MSDKYNKEEPSVIQKIQNQTGCLLLVIGIAMLAFVLTDLFSSRTSMFGKSANSVGTIDGESVDVQEYNEIYDGILANLQAQNPGLQLDERFLASYKQQAWNLLVQAKLVSKEYEKLGITVSGAEMEDITIGDNTHPQLRQAFVNPESGQFDKARLVRYLREDIEASPDQKAQWLSFEQELIKQLKTEKYSALMRSAFYVTDLEVLTEATRRDMTVNASMVGLSFNTIPDSTITVSEKDIANYVKEHRSEYEQTASRDIEFVAFDVVPSKEDSASTLEWITSNTEKFRTATDDSLFVSLMGTETPYDSEFKVRGNFTSDVEDDLFNAEAGELVGPFENKGTYALFKIVDIGEDSLRSVRASHIMINVGGRTAEDTATALSEARTLLADIRAGRTDWETEAKNKNYDGTGDKAGDLGWLREGTRTASEEFVDKALSAGNGNYFVVASRNGVQIGKVTSAVSRKTIQVARLTQTVIPSTETDREYYRMAGEFLAKAKGDEAFEDVAEGLGYSKKVSKKITEDDRRVAGIENGNIIARWLFDSETEEGDVSDIIEVDGKYVVAHCTKVRKDGLPDVEDVRSKVEPIVLGLKKGEILKKKFEEAIASGAESAEDLSKALETQVTPAPGVAYSSGSLPYIGSDDKVLGTIMGTAVGKRSEIIVGENGVYVVYVNNENEYELPANPDDYKAELSNSLNGDIEGDVERALLDIGKVKDLRYKFFN